MLQTLASDAKIKIKFVICELFIVTKSCEFVFPWKKDILVLCLVIELWLFWTDIISSIICLLVKFIVICNYRHAIDFVIFLDLQKLYLHHIKIIELLNTEVWIHSLHSA